MELIFVSFWVLFSPFASTIPHGPFRGGGDPWRIIATWRRGMKGGGEEPTTVLCTLDGASCTHCMQGYVRSYAIGAASSTSWSEGKEGPA